MRTEDGAISRFQDSPGRFLAPLRDVVGRCLRRCKICLGWLMIDNDDVKLESKIPDFVVARRILIVLKQYPQKGSC